jgi:hypothetical protein
MLNVGLDVSYPNMKGYNGTRGTELNTKPYIENDEASNS